MAVVAAAKKRMTYAEYLAFEAASDTKHEFIAGHVIAMAGGTIEHGRILSRIAMLLGGALAGRPCVVLSSDVRVRIRTADRATYPDIHVVCGQIERDAEDEHAIVNPTLVVEVLSDSTAETDRGDKFFAYRRLRSLKEYVLISQYERVIDVYRRDGRRWVVDAHERGDAVRLESIDVTLALDDVYEDALGAIIA